MLPVVEYTNITLVIPKVTAVGKLFTHEDEVSGFEVFLIGSESPVVVECTNFTEAEDTRRELIGIIAQYYYTQEYGPDFQLEDLLEELDDEELQAKKLSADDADMREKH